MSKKFIVRTKKDWLISDMPEGITKCDCCGKGLIFFIYNEDGGKRAIPKYHEGTCRMATKHKPKKAKSLKRLTQKPKGEANGKKKTAPNKANVANVVCSA